MKTGFLACAALAAFTWLTPNAARADFVLQVYEDGTLKDTFTESGAPPYSTIARNESFADFSIALVVSISNAPGTPTLGNLQLSNVDVKNLVSGSHTITVKVSAQDYTAPNGVGAGLVLADTVSGSVNKGTLTSGDFTASIDTTNALFGATTSAPTITFGPTGANQSFSGSSLTGVDIPSTYSMTLAGNWTIAGGSELTLTGGNGSVLVPEPASMSMLAMGGGILGAIGFIRRRKLQMA